MRYTFKSIIVNSIRHLWRMRAFWIIQGILAIGPVLISSIAYLAEPNNPLTLRVGVPGVGTLALNYLVLPFLVAPAILDDFGKVGEILWSSPLDNLVYFAGRFSGLWLGLTLGSMLQLCAWFLASLLWFNLLTEWVWLVSLVIYLLANFLGLSAVILLSVLFRRKLPLMLSWGVLWVWFFYQVIFAESLAEGFNPMSTTAFTNIFFHNLSLSPSLGLGLAAGRVSGMFAWFFGLGMFTLSLSLSLTSLVDRRRKTRKGWLPPTLIGISLLSAVTGYLINVNAISAHVVPPSPQGVQVDAWQVLSQHTEVDANAENGKVSGETEMVFSLVDEIERAEIVLKLNTGLNMTWVGDENDQILDVERVGDSVVIDLPAIPQSPMILNLAWEGDLQIPYLAFEQQWRWHDAPDSMDFKYMPQALRGFLRPNGGFLLRDGDWMPWPWSTGPHQATDNYLAIRPQGAATAASADLENGVAIWEGTLPEGLVVFLPEKQVESGGITLSMSRLVGQQHQERANLFANAARTVARLYDIPEPRQVVILSYLNKVIWSGNLLLIPDGSGYYLERPLLWLYYHDVNDPQKQPMLARNALHALARAYLLDRITPSTMEIKALLTPQGREPEVVFPAVVSEQRWVQGQGRWVQKPEVFDFDTWWTPRRQISLNQHGEWSSVAFWLAMELADKETRQADLNGFVFFDETDPDDDRSARNDLMRDLIWPEILFAAESREIVVRMHAMTEQLGTQEVLTLLAVTLNETQPETVNQLLVDMEQRIANQSNEVHP